MLPRVTRFFFYAGEWPMVKHSQDFVSRDDRFEVSRDMVGLKETPEAIC